MEDPSAPLVLSAAWDFRGLPREISEEPQDVSLTVGRDSSVKPVSEESVAALFTAVSKCTTLALACRQKEQYERAIKHLERAVRACEVVGEQSHPRVALVLAKTRLNLSAMLSQSGRHEEAMLELHRSEEALAALLAWCDTCDPHDIGVCAVFEEVVSLTCHTLIAAAVEEEHFGPLLATPARTPEENGEPNNESAPHPCCALYEDAVAMAAELLGPTHPMIPYTRAKRDSFVKRCLGSGMSTPLTASVLDEQSASSRISRVSTAPGKLPIEVQADPQRWNLAPASSKLELDEAEGGYMLRWRASTAPARPQDAEQRTTKASEKLERKATKNKEFQNRKKEPESMHHEEEVHVEHKSKKNPFVEWIEGDTGQSEKRRWHVDETFQNFSRKKLLSRSLGHHGFVEDVAHLSPDKLFENRTHFTEGMHKIRSRELCRNNISRSQPLLKTDEQKKRRKRRKEDFEELLSLEATTAQKIQEELHASFRRLVDTSPKLKKEACAHLGISSKSKHSRPSSHGSSNHAVGHMAPPPKTAPAAVTPAPKPHAKNPPPAKAAPVMRTSAADAGSLMPTVDAKVAGLLRRGVQ